MKNLGATSGKSYATPDNAEAALIRALKRCPGIDANAVRFVITVADDGRFAPAVILPQGDTQSDFMLLPHVGIRIIG